MSDSEDLSEEIQSGYPGQQESVAADIPTHISADKLNGVRYMTLHIALPAGATLESLQRNHKDGYYWEPPAHVKNQIRHIVKMQGRANPSEEDLEGSIRKMLFTSADVLTENSNSPKDIAVDIPGLVPEYVTDNNRHNWVIDRGVGTTTPIGTSIFNPDNLFTEDMYKKLEERDLASLKNHINLNADPSKTFALMETRGIGWSVMEREWHQFPEYHATVMKNNPQMFDGSVQKVSYMAKVPYALAEEIHNALAEPIKAIENSYVDFSKFRVKMSPADGQAWNHEEGLIRETMGLDSESKEYERETAQVRPVAASIRLRIGYILGND